VDLNNEKQRKAIYVKCRPQDCDLRPFVNKHQKVFIGHAPFRRGIKFDRHNIRTSIADISRGDLSDTYHSKTVSAQVKFAQTVSRGDIVVIPRPGEGLCYLGRILDRFQLENDPPWADEYLELRRRQGLSFAEADGHISDVVQYWPLEGPLKTVPFPFVPRWITYSLLSRNTIGWLHDRPDGHVLAIDVLTDMYEQRFKPRFTPVSSTDEVETRLLDWVSPSLFEHLVCALLQCKDVKDGLHWWHTGGSGDGGADALAVDDEGRLRAILQCKLHLTASPVEVTRTLQMNLGKDMRVIYVASIYHDQSLVENVAPGVVFWGRKKIAQLLLEYRAQMAMAWPLSGTVDR
jgi:hypothetical protein